MPWPRILCHWLENDAGPANVIRDGQWSSALIRQPKLKALSEMVDGMDFMDDMDIEKTHLLSYVHFVHNVHSVNYLDKPNWLRLPNPVY